MFKALAKSCVWILCEIFCLNLCWNLIFKAWWNPVSEAALTGSWCVLLAHRSVVLQSQELAASHRKASCFSQRSWLLLASHRSCLCLQLGHPPSSSTDRFCFAGGAQKELSKNLRKRREAIIIGEARIGGETQHKFETRSTNNQWRTSAEMSRNPNAEMQVILSLKL